MRTCIAIALCAGLVLPAVNALVLPQDPLAEAIARARDATRAQALGAGFALPLSKAPSADAPSVALAALLLQLGHAPSPGELAALATLDASPGQVRGATARLIAAFAAFDAAARAAPLSLHLATQAPVLAARQHLLEAGLGLRDAVRVVPAAALPPPIEVGPVVLDFGTADDVYARPLALVWDQGGNDQHLNNAGGSNLGLARPALGVGGGAAALFDLAGDDVFGTGTGRSGVNGGGFGGAGFLLDQGGHDWYRGLDDGVNGGAFLGTGFLLDVAGNDRYDSLGWGTNGGGYPGGLGFLLDQGGHDAYVGTHDAVNGGAFLGAGLLWDVAGDDSYLATNTGVNGGGVGGLGLLRDDGGRDWYLDEMGGTGWDVSVLPKELSGIQQDTQA